MCSPDVHDESNERLPWEGENFDRINSPCFFSFPRNPSSRSKLCVDDTFPIFVGQSSRRFLEHRFAFIKILSRVRSEVA